jgi:hypothetical protein
MFFYLYSFLIKNGKDGQILKRKRIYPSGINMDFKFLPNHWYFFIDQTEGLITQKLIRGLVECISIAASYSIITGKKMALLIVHFCLRNFH